MKIYQKYSRRRTIIDKLYCKILNYKIRQFLHSIYNIIRWVPILWKDKDWDSAYALRMLQKKLLYIRNYIVYQDRYTSVDNSNRDITICLNLIERILCSWYETEPYNYIDIKLKFIPYEGENIKIADDYCTVGTELIGDISIYLRKYPLIVKRMKKEYPERKEDSLYILVAWENERRCLNLLTKILNEKLMTWWD